VTDPRFTVARIAIDYDAVQEPRIGTALMEHVLVNGSHVDHNRDPAKPKEIVYHATPARPLTIDRIAAAHVELESALVIEVIGIEGIDIALKDAHVELGAGMKLDDGELGLSGSAVRQVKVANLQVTQFDHIRVRARGVFDPGEAVNINGGAKFALDVTVSGIANELSGSGTGTLDALTGSKQTKAKVGFACEHSDGINVPLEYDFAVGGVSLAVDFISGSVQAKAEIGPLALAVHSTSGDECVTEVKHWVVVSKGWTWGICTQLLPPKAWRCRWETPELSFNYRIKFAIRLAVGALVITRPLIYLDDNRLRICNLGIVQTTGLGIAGGYSPQIVTPFGGDGEKIINAFISTAFELPQTLVASSIASGAGWLISGVATPLGNAMCLF
jgi:hypothetical protein